MTVIDGSNAILGRLATNVAKRVLKGEKVHVVNAEKIVITGNAGVIKEKFQGRLDIGPKGNPHYGPKASRMPERIVRRAIRGMLPWKKAKGRTAFRNLRTHIGVPQELEAEKPIVIEGAVNRHEKGFVTVGDLSKALGAKW